ncbi:MAG: DUF5714 domain-containing protein [Treponema sp.]|nr:DUF5714 domain-containing protein [Treponema sp.]
MTLEEKATLIIKDIKSQTGTDPCAMFRNMVKNEYIKMHGPEHHILDGACLLMAFYNAGGKINGPRCCKRDAMIAFKNAIEYVNNNYGVKLNYSEQKCSFTSINQQCIKERCPFFE